jgi:hypothetical protein
MEETRIPEMQMSDNKIVLDTIDVPIIFNKEKRIVKMQKLTAGGRRDSIKKYLATSLQGQQISGKIEDVLGIQITLLSKIIKEAPFDFSEKGIEQLPEEVIDYLYGQYEEWVKKKPIIA